MKRLHFTITLSRLFLLIVAFTIVATTAIFSYSTETTTEEKQKSSEAISKATPADSLPDLAEIVPLEIKLNNSLQGLEKQLNDGVDSKKLDDEFLNIENRLVQLEETLANLKELQEYKYNKLVDLRELIQQKRSRFEIIVAPVSESISSLGVLKKEWQSEEKRWLAWQDALLNEGEFEQLRSTFSRATETIQSALDLVLSRLDTLLGVQERAGNIERRIDTLYGEIDNQIVEERRNTLFNDTPPMFSLNYLEQIKNIQLWEEILGEIHEVSLPETEALNQHGWIILFQLFISALLIFIIKKRKNVFEQTERWNFFVHYPIASAVFLGYVLSILIYEYQGVPNSWKLVATLIGTTAFAFLIRGVVDEKWKAHFIYGFVVIVLTTRLMDILGFPIPIFRLYICLAALLGLCFCFYLVKQLKTAGKSGVFLWLLQSGVCFFFVIFVIEILGKKGLGSYLFISMLRSLGAIFVFSLLMYILRGGLEWLFDTPLLRRSTALDDSETDSIIIKLTRFFDSLIILLVILPTILMVWGVFRSLKEAIYGVITFGFNIGSNHITVGLLVVSASIIYSSFLISWVVQKLLIDEVLFEQRMEKGARISIARLVHYMIVVVGFLFAVSALGIEISKLTIMFSALGVGIGFGMKDIVNNFISGLILLFEQPIRAGDLVEIEGVWAEIKGIGIRSTVVRTFDHADLIIPNADLISNKVTNWTLSDRQARLIVQVGVAYGSDIELVLSTLCECAEENKLVASSPSPRAYILNFGASSLDFELRAFVAASMRIQVKSELIQEIDKRFRDKEIVISFPQLDLHIPGLPNKNIEEVAPEAT